MKRCHKCHTLKSNKEFNKNKRLRDGLQYICKVCDYETEKDGKHKRGYYHSEKYRERMKKSESRKRAITKYNQTHKKEIAARGAVREAIKKSVLIKPFGCAIRSCLSKNVTAHHYMGYKKVNWLDVIWLCNKHHIEAHRSKSI